LNKDHPAEFDDDGVDLDLFEGGLKNVKFIMKNGCCRECMKAFSKTGKVRFTLCLYNYSLVYVKCLDFREGLLYQQMDASIAVVRAATP